jgi:putative DNA-binding protein
VITHPEGAEAGAITPEAQRLISLPRGELEKIIIGTETLSAGERLAIYAHAYYARLTECLTEVFPILKRALGEEVFHGFALDYLRAHPSRSYTLNELGRRFPEYLRATRPASGEGQTESVTGVADEADEVLRPEWPEFLIDLARLEWAIYEVFDGPGVEGQKLLSADDLLGIGAERWPNARLELVPCFVLLETVFPVNDYYTAARSSTEEVPLPEPEESFVALTRRDYIVRRYNVSRAEFALMRALREKRTVGEAIESAANASEDAPEIFAGRLELWFRNWTAEGFFRAVQLT